MIQNGTIVQTHTIQLKTHLDEDEAEVLSFAIAQLRQTFNSQSVEIIVPVPIEYFEEGVVVTIPKGGEKKKLLDLSAKNADYFTEEIKKKKILQLEGHSD